MKSDSILSCWSSRPRAYHALRIVMYSTPNQHCDSFDRINFLISQKSSQNFAALTRHTLLFPSLNPFNAHLPISNMNWNRIRASHAPIYPLFAHKTPYLMYVISIQYPDCRLVYSTFAYTHTFDIHNRMVYLYGLTGLTRFAHIS